MKVYKKSLTHPYGKSHEQVSKELDRVFAQQRERVIASLEHAEYRMKERLGTLYVVEDESLGFPGEATMTQAKAAIDKEWELIQRR